jgi:hypothetical protein
MLDKLSTRGKFNQMIKTATTSNFALFATCLSSLQTFDTTANGPTAPIVSFLTAFTKCINENTFR